MTHLTDVFLVLMLFSVLLALGANRLMELVEIMLFQGIVVSLIPLALAKHQLVSGGHLALVSVTLLIKAVLIPLFLYLAIKKTAIKREVEPIIGYHASIFVGMGLILASAFVSHRLLLDVLVENERFLTVAFTTMGAGFFLLVARRKAITQVIGYLMMENGIFLVGSTLATEAQSQYVVEFGVLLDLLVGVMVMGIIVHHINRTFDDIDTIHLGSLKH